MFEIGLETLKEGFWHHPYSVCDHWRCTNTAFETRNEPSFAEIGRKSTSVDQKVSSIVVLSFSDKDLFISIIFSSRFMVISRVFWTFHNDTVRKSRNRPETSWTPSVSQNLWVFCKNRVNGPWMPPSITINRLVGPLVGPFSIVSPLLWDILFLVWVTVFWSQYHAKSKKIIQQCHHRSKIVENSQNPDGDGLEKK